MSRFCVPSPFPTGHKPKIPAAILRPRSQAPSAPTRSHIVASIGEQIRALRLAATLSGDALALRSDISRIERGLVSPSVETLDRIAHGLGQPLSRFFPDQPSRTDLSVVRAGHGIAVDRVGAVAGFDYELLGHGLSANLFDRGGRRVAVRCERGAWHRFGGGGAGELSTVVFTLRS